MKPLRRIFHERPRGTAWKWPHYFAIYERHLAGLRGKPVTLLEIGIHRGGSLSMWKEYFPGARIVGIDIEPDTKKHESEDVAVCIGDQADAAFLSNVAREHGPFDVVVDDGGHKWRQQIISLTTLFPYLKSEGIYIIEDLHKSYWPSRPRARALLRLVRSYLRPYPPTIRFLKGLVDRIHFRRTGETDAIFSDEVRSVCFYEGIAVIEKGRTPSDHSIRSGQLWDARTRQWVDAEVDEEGNFVR